MRPWRLVDETLQQLRRRNGAAMAPAGILHVGEFRIDHLVVFRPERHSPYPLADFVADLDEPFGEPVVIGEQTAILPFMSSMLPAGLIEMPPVSKQTPLPMKASGAAPRLPPFQRMMTVRLS